MLLLLPQLAATVSAEGEAIAIDTTTLSGEPQTVPIRLSGFTNPGAMTIILAWDESFIHVTRSNDTLPGGAILGNPSVDKPVAISCFSATGFSGDAVLAYMTLTPLKPRQGLLDLDVSICVDIAANPLAPQIVDGTVTVAQAVASTGGESRPDKADSGRSSPDNAPHDVTDSGTRSSPLIPSDLSTAPVQVLPNQEVVISANICNSGGERGSKTVSLMLNGEAIDSQSVSVSPSACQQVIFKTSRAVPGTYQVAIDGMTGQFSVLAPRTVTNNAPSQQQTGLGKAGIVAIIAVLILVFKRDYHLLLFTTPQGGDW